ncbi:tetratricopeptide repeat protein [Nocardia sp. CA-120079]|uniref:tetratricopeptide repeat protein n=1 Tax=Nocardia sp. CA-120079 TaxID=3239974 RepID=UPI003D98EAEF
MPVDLSCRLVFLASPGGLSSERKRCRKVFREYNETRSLKQRTSFYIHAWEDVSGGVGRPQDLINPSLDECDFVLMLFNDRFGSPPAHDDRFASGTEEEFFRALKLLADAESPMRDILVLFKTVDPDRIRDPGPDLKAVLDFRARLEASKSLVLQNFDSLDSLSQIVERKLHEWSGPLESKQPREILIPEATVDMSGMRTRGRADLLESAKSFALDGLLVQAEAAYAAATEDGDPRSLLSFAQFMRRTGRLEQAMALNRQVVTNSDLLLSRSAGPVALRVEAMSNIGVIQRKQGEITGSLSILLEAVRTAETALEPIHREHCYALDNYGLSLLRTGESSRALVQFERADFLRDQYGTNAERAQSAVNLGRQHLAQHQFQDALNKFGRALRLLEADPDEHLKANALTGRAEVLIRLDREDEADELLREALELNEHLHHRDGRSIVHALWARSLLKQGQSEKAGAHLDAAAKIVDESGNLHGRGVVEWLRAERARCEGDLIKARALLSDAEEIASRSTDRALRADIERLRAAIQEA